MTEIRNVTVKDDHGEKILFDTIRSDLTIAEFKAQILNRFEWVNVERVHLILAGVEIKNDVSGQSNTVGRAYIADDEDCLIAWPQIKGGSNIQKEDFKKKFQSDLEHTNHLLSNSKGYILKGSNFRFPSIRACPNCNFIVEITRECKHMTCGKKNCNTEFCMGCLKIKKNQNWECGGSFEPCGPLSAPRQVLK